VGLDVVEYLPVLDMDMTSKYIGSSRCDVFSTACDEGILKLSSQFSALCGNSVASRV
jgi:hypothetical protein